MILPKISLRIERWKFNKEYGVYVSTLGNFKDRYKRNLPIRINKGGYCSIKTEVANYTPAHRLVMFTWKPIPDAENLTVDHLDHNKRNNSLTNLEWVTEAENLRRAAEDREQELPTKPKGPKSIKKHKAKIIGIRVNKDIVPVDVNAVYEIMRKVYYKGGYPKATIQRTVDDLLSGKNSGGSKKLGQKVKISLVYEGE